MAKVSRIQLSGTTAFRVSFFLHLVVFFILVVSFVFLFPSFAASEIYKWKGADGNVVFSDSPPSGSKAEEVKIKDDMRFEIPPSRETGALKTVKGNKAATGQRLRDIRDINVVLYMTDW